MGAKKKENIVTKKIIPYPIKVQIQNVEINSTLPLQGQILRLTSVGFQMEFPQLHFSVGEVYKTELMIPHFQKKISENVRVVKTMDRYLDGKAKQKVYIVEMHFLKLGPINAKAIAEFELAINQKKD